MTTVRRTWPSFLGVALAASVILNAAVLPVSAAEINVNTFGAGGWYANDVRADNGMTPAYANNFNIVGLTKTDSSYANAPTNGTTAGDVAIDSYIKFGTPPTAPPTGQHQGALNLTLSGSTGTSGKTDLSHINMAGHAAGSSFTSPSFLARYSWMGDGGSSNYTTALKVGFRTSESMGLSPRTGENSWDKLLVYEPYNQPVAQGGTAHYATAVWHEEFITKTAGAWWIVDRTRGFSGTAQGNVLNLTNIATSTVSYSGTDTLSIVFAHMTAPTSSVTNIHFGIGSNNPNGNVYVNEFETSWYQAGNITTFGSAGFAAGDVDADSDIDEDDHWALADHLDGAATAPNPDVDGNTVVNSEDSRVLAQDLLLRNGGDTDVDGDVDNSDLGQAFGNFTGPGGTGKHWALGDFDGDEDVDNSDLGDAFGNFTGPIAAGNLVDTAGEADLIYDPATGNVKLDATEATGGVITNFVLQNAAGGMDFNAPGTAVFPTPTSSKTDLATELSWTDGTQEGFSGIWELGNVFPTGLDLTGLAAFLTRANYVGEIGTGNRVLDLVVVAAVEEVVPEPGTLVLMALGCVAGIGVLRRRRRKQA